LQSLAFDKLNCIGVEDFSIDEARVDEILGDRSYSGGDVPKSVVDEVEYTVDSETECKKFYFDSEVSAQDFIALLRENHVIDINLSTYADEDWGKKWRENFQPIIINSNLTIYPSWHREESNADQIFIYPGQGFGTGNHETTFLCLKLFEEFCLDKNCEEVLDFGCGSGILGIAAYKLKKCRIDLYDIDSAALENTKQNLDINEIKSDYSLILPIDRTQIEKKYDLVFANILQNVLMLECGFLADSLKTGGHLVLSGLLVGQEDEVITKYLKHNQNLEVLKIEYRNDWVAVLLKQK